MAIRPVRPHARIYAPIIGQGDVRLGNPLSTPSPPPMLRQPQHSATISGCAACKAVTIGIDFGAHSNWL